MEIRLDDWLRKTSDDVVFCCEDQHHSQGDDPMLITSQILDTADESFHR